MTAERERVRPRTIVILVAVVVTLLASPYVVLGGTLVWRSLSERAARRAFEPVAWRSPARIASRDPMRLRMVDDLLARRLLDGRTRDEVRALLGPADSTPYFRDWDFVYWLGPERGYLSIDSEWLGVRFDADGRVLETRLLRD